MSALDGEWNVRPLPGVRKRSLKKIRRQARPQNKEGKLVLRHTMILG